MKSYNEIIERDDLLVKAAGVKNVAHTVGYNEYGEAIELVFDPATKTFDIHVAGEHVKEAPQQIVEQFLQ